MKRVTSVGGIFFKCKDPEAQMDWYATHLGIVMDKYGTSFQWRQADDKEKKGHTAWSAFKDDTDYFGHPSQQYMINYRVENLELLVEQLKKEGVTIADEIAEFEYGKFIHILDLEGNRVELWEANDDVYEKMLNAVTK
ncbi:MAG: VOC family protein [Chitinophagaceae bacterium]|nr:VOC family protein [Chitinophagaceae bacterium]